MTYLSTPVAIIMVYKIFQISSMKVDRNVEKTCTHIAVFVEEPSILDRVRHVRQLRGLSQLMNWKAPCPMLELAVNYNSTKFAVSIAEFYPASVASY